MRLLLFAAALAFFSCRNKDLPDVSKIKVSLPVQRFEKALFTADTAAFPAALEKLIAEYPDFGENFTGVILGIDPRTPVDTAASLVKGFISYSRNVFDTSEKLFADFSAYRQELEQASRYVKYYFPNYKLPRRIITYIGPANGYGDILDTDAFVVGLHAHLGADFPLYFQPSVQETYPVYFSRRFTPETISVNAMTNIVNDMYPENFSDQPLIVQMIEKGKRLYLLSKFLPMKKEHLLIGYTEKQLKDSYGHEAVIWDLFTQNNYLQSTDANVIKNYVGESPKTQELGEGAPGNIGSFAGWQIVKKYMAANDNLKPAELMAADAQKIFAAARYKP